MKSIKELRKNNKKGFTLVELIVVLVILAILAALLIPTLTGYIDKAKKKDITAQTRQAVMAAQTLVDEAYAKKTDSSEVAVGASNTDVTYTAIEELAEVAKSTGTDNKSTGNGVSNVTVVKGKVTSLTYKNKGKTCIYDGTNSTYTIDNEVQ